MPQPRFNAPKFSRVALIAAGAIVLIAGLGVATSPAAASEVDSTSPINGSPINGYRWGADVTLFGLDWDGNRTTINTVPGWKDKVFGVAGGRWGDQIDYTSTGGGRGESMIVRFRQPATNVVLEIGMLGASEGDKDGAGRSIDESGRWVAYGSAGSVLGQGRISPDESTLGPRVRTSGSYGLFRSR